MTGSLRFAERAPLILGVVGAAGKTHGYGKRRGFGGERLWAGHTCQCTYVIPAQLHK